jgi:hypothetical protein
MADAPLLIYPQDLPNAHEHAAVESKARRVAEALEAMLLSDTPSSVVVS